MNNLKEKIFPTPACFDCKFSYFDDDTFGDCRHNTPEMWNQSAGDANPRQGVWPMICAGDFCGKFKHKQNLIQRIVTKES